MAKQTSSQSCRTCSGAGGSFRIFGGLSAAFFLLAALLIGRTAVHALQFASIRITTVGYSWELGSLLKNAYVLLPASALATGAVFGIFLAATGKARWWIASACALGFALAVYGLIPPRIWAVAQHAELRSFLGYNLLPFVSGIHILPFQAAECLSGAALLAAGIGLFRTRISQTNQPDTERATMK